MEMNLSMETIRTIMISLRDSERELKRQIDITEDKKVLTVLRYQLNEVKDAIFVFEDGYGIEI